MLDRVPAEVLDGILQQYRGRRGVLLEVFHRVQEAFGYVPPETLEPIAKALHMHAPTVYGTLTFYTEFRMSPPPAVQINICLGPACHLLGAEAIKQVIEYQLSIDHEGRSSDNAYGIHVVQCAGHCHKAPLLYINGKVKGNVAMSEVVELAAEARALPEAKGR